MNYALVNCNLLDGTKEMTLKSGVTVNVENDIITDISESKVTSKGCKIIDLHNKYLMPGLINMHSHLAGNGIPNKHPEKIPEQIQQAIHSKTGRAFLKKIVKKSAATQLMSGVTTTRTVGEIAYLDLEVRDMINEQKITGPRMLVAGTGITVHGGHAEGIFACPADSEDECMRLVRENHGKSVDLIKLFVTGGVFDATVRGEPGVLRMRPEFVKASCDEAHRLGLKVASHAESMEGVRVSLTSGVDTIEHGSRMDDDIISLYKDTGASLIATISPALNLVMMGPEITNLTGVHQYNANTVLEGIIEGARQAIDHGIPLGLGTDAADPFVFQYAMWREVCYFAKYVGVSNRYALYTATLKNAELLGLDRLIGSIEKGKNADMIVLEKNPLGDLTALRDVAAVMVKGKFIKNPKYKRFAKLDAKIDGFNYEF
jgi:imidazolonepropionase-like amidohydrolase